MFDYARAYEAFFGPRQIAASSAWNRFYRCNKAKFFKDRHWTFKEFGRLSTTSSLLEVGCGVGNFLRPFCDLNQRAAVYGCDCSPVAINLLKQSPLSSRVSSFVCDASLAGSNLLGVKVETVVAIFVLSAILTDEGVAAALMNCRNALLSGGSLLIRDYAVGDCASSRLTAGAEENVFIRGDGTVARFFDLQPLCKALEGIGFFISAAAVKERTQENRKTRKVLDRKFIQIEAVRKEQAL